jgi:hypothetical protein
MCGCLLGHIFRFWAELRGELTDAEFTGLRTNGFAGRKAFGSIDGGYKMFLSIGMIPGKSLESSRLSKGTHDTHAVVRVHVSYLQGYRLRECQNIY